MLADQKHRLEVSFSHYSGIVCIYSLKSKERPRRRHEDVGLKVFWPEGKAKKKISLNWRSYEDLQENEITNGGLNLTIGQQKGHDVKVPWCNYRLDSNKESFRHLLKNKSFEPLRGCKRRAKGERLWKEMSRI